MQSLKERTGKGLFWGGMNNLVQQVIGVVFGIVLGRLLSQSDYGMMAMISVFSLVATALQNSGFTVALVNLDSPEHRDYNSVFWFNILAGGVLYVVLFLSAPLIARFYDNAALVPLCRYAFLSIVIASFGTAQTAWLFKHLRAKEQAKAAMAAVVTSSLTGAVMAFCGLAYWSLATQGLVYVLVNTIFVWRYSEWRPSVTGITFAPVVRMFRFSSRILLTTIAGIINNNVLNILLGRLFGERRTGVYNQAYQWSFKCYSLVQNMVNQVAQPVLVDLRADGGRQLNALRKLMRFTAFVSFPLLLGLSSVAKEFIVLAITAKWLASAELLRILCISGAVVPLSALLSNLVISKGRSGTYLYVTLSLGLAQIICMLLVWREGIRTMVIAYTALNIVWLFVWYVFCRRLTGYGFGKFLSDVLPFALTASAVAFGVVRLTGGLVSLWALLAAKCVLFAVLYYAVMKLLGVKILRECEQFVVRRLRR
ncbi:MAG: lipopolysaccharide biosynthesis protein [Prevotella sp.]|nr:lipopolysaccharide biosynthesis protein [Prevotella sp.]